ncbi:hypothetical protein DFJ74DRAFT_661786 [Hyaloraphidium curvatum]|nr:hypothetical protein DFJ74DRAFT_661786 [Hyaloraphidium curvatum]
MLVEVYDGNRGWEAANVNVRDFGIDFTPNLRRPFLIRMSRSTFTLDVSGTRLMTVSNLGLPFQRGSVHFQQFANVTNANSMPLVTVHWDNFGFSSVSPARRVVRSYRGTNDANYRLAGPTLDVSEFTYSVSIPDDLSQATAARLKFSRQGDRNSNERFWDGTAVVCFNDRAYTVWGQPTVCTAMVPGWTPVNRTIGPVASGDPQGVILQLPAAALRASNRIIISLPANMWVGDVHVEVDFPAGYAGAYTPPRPWFGDLPAPTFHPGRNVASGPMAKLTRIAGNLLWETPGLYAAMVAPGGIPVGSTMLLVEGEADSSIGFQVMGRAVGVVRIELQLDRRTVRTWTFPSPGIQYYYWSMELDVSDLAPGPHELHTVAYDEEGRISIPNYDFPNILPDRKLYPGAYMPAKITI